MISIHLTFIRNIRSKARLPISAYCDRLHICKPCHPEWFPCWRWGYCAYENGECLDFPRFDFVFEWIFCWESKIFGMFGWIKLTLPLIFSLLLHPIIFSTLLLPVRWTLFRWFFETPRFPLLLQEWWGWLNSWNKAALYCPNLICFQLQLPQFTVCFMIFLVFLSLIH